MKDMLCHGTMTGLVKHFEKSDGFFFIKRPSMGVELGVGCHVSSASFTGGVNCIAAMHMHS